MTKAEDELHAFDERLARISGRMIVGIDEAGRGPLAGPVVAAAVLMREHVPGVDDSKSLSRKVRDELFSRILENSIVGIGLATSEEIDRHNILRATNLAMLRALKRIFEMVDRERCILVVDGTNVVLPGPSINLVKADEKSASVAAASIVAKVFRDRLMEIYDSIYPGYDFSSNKGYPTSKHLKALETQGLSRIHRKTFKHGR